MKQIARAIMAFAASTGFAAQLAAATVNVIPPASGSRNSITINGRTYSSPKGVAITVPDFDASILQANGWTIAPATQTESVFAVLRRLNGAVPGPSVYNTSSTQRLYGSTAWAATTVISTGQIVSKGGLAYIATSGGTTGSIGPTGRGIGQADGTVTWDYYGPQTAPTITNLNATTHVAALTKIWTTAAHFTEGCGVGLVRWRGGVPQQQDTSPAYVSTVSTTVPAGIGLCTFGASSTCTRNPTVPGIEFDFEGNEIEFKFKSNTENIKVMIDGVYIDISVAIISGAPTRYFTLDFTNVVSPLDRTTEIGRARHRIRLEWGVNLGLEQIAMKPASAIFYPTITDEWSIGVVGDSQTVGGNALQDIAQSWPYQVGKFINAPDVVVSGTGGTGFVANGGAAYTYGQRAFADLALANTYRPIKMIIVQGSQNDIGQNGVAAAVTSFFTALRAQFPGIPILVTGVVKVTNVTSANATLIENAIFGALPDDPLIFKIPVTTAQDPWFSGTGKTTAQTGDGVNDFDVSSDGAHLSLDGQAVYARRMAAEIMRIARAIP